MTCQRRAAIFDYSTPRISFHCVCVKLSNTLQERLSFQPLVDHVIVPVRVIENRKSTLVLVVPEKLGTVIKENETLTSKTSKQ